MEIFTSNDSRVFQTLILSNHGRLEHDENIFSGNNSHQRVNALRGGRLHGASMPGQETTMRRPIHPTRSSCGRMRQPVNQACHRCGLLQRTAPIGTVDAQTAHQQLLASHPHRQRIRPVVTLCRNGHKPRTKDLQMEELPRAAQLSSCANHGSATKRGKHRRDS